jgi:CBS domain-containing protein
MWWPAIGGLVVGIGGLIFPQALGVGYDTIGRLLQGNVTVQVILGILIVKSIIWSVSLGSGTSGGVLAPLLMMGGALGGLEAAFLPNEGLGFWPLVSMGAILGGTMRSPFTGIIFALELTHDVNMLLPLLIAVIIAHGFTVIVMRRSILTEKVSRRGYHLSREYATDPLEILFVREVMRTNIVALSDKISPKDLAQSLNVDHGKNSQFQRLYPVLDDKERLIGVVTRKDLQQFIQDVGDGNTRDGNANVPTGEKVGIGPLGVPHEESSHLAELIHTHPAVAYPDEPLRAVVYRMAETGFTRFPVVERDNPQQLVGMISLNDLLKARVRNLEEERRRERVLRMRLFFPSRAPRTSQKV